jgi:VWFA-related protein
MKFNLFALFILIFAFFGAVSYGQDETIRVETNLVTVNVAVNDKNGKFVSDLRREQFEIFDNRQKQQIADFSVEGAPVTYGIVYDMHPTTAERTKTILESLRAFTKELRKEDDFFVVAFNQTGSLAVDFVPTVEQLEKFIPDRREPNSLYDAVYLAADKIRENRNLKRTLIIVSDSADHGSRHSFSNLSGKLKNLDVQIYAVIFDEDRRWLYRDVTLDGKQRRSSNDATALERAALSDLTLKSGGTAHFPTGENSRMLYEIYSQIAVEMRQKYTISFYPSATDGKWHDLRVNLRDAEGSKKFALTYRRGYQSPPLKNEK